jgi:hypothetical protein
MAPLPESLLQAGAGQFGLVTRQQALETLTRSQLHRRINAGLLVVVGRSVYRLPGVPATWRQRALATCLELGPPVAVSHGAAAYAWRAVHLVPPRVEVTIPRDRRLHAKDAKVYRRLLPEVDVIDRWGIPVTSAARTVIDLSTAVARPLLWRIADDMLRRRQLDIKDLTRRLALDAPLPRFSHHRIEEIILARGGGVGDSPAENWVFDTIVGAGLPAPVHHFRAIVGGSIRELDCAYPEWLIGIDYDGWSVHHDASHFHGDRERQAAFQLEGWILLQVTLAWTAEQLVERVAAAIERRRQGQAG